MGATTEGLKLCGLEKIGEFLVVKMKERLQAMASLEYGSTTLNSEMEQLSAGSKDKEQQAQTQLRQKHSPFELSAKLKNWLKDVHKISTKVDDFDRRLKGPQVDRWDVRLWTRFKLSGEVADLREEVRELRKRGDDMTELVIEGEGGRETDDIVIVGAGAENALRDIRSYLQDNKVGVVGIYGTAGVGKSNLLKQIKQDHTYDRSTSVYQPVIWAEVTRYVDMDGPLENPFKAGADIQRLRNDIGQKLPSSSAGDWDAQSLKQALLSCQSFLLLLENVWEPLNLDEIGIPKPNSHNKYKIVFTTRSSAVCNDMEAQPVELRRLTEDEGLELFRLELRKDRLFLSFEDHARMIVKECHGLPLALKVIASVMRNKHFEQDWPDTIDELRDPRTMFNAKAMGEKDVFRILRYSYYHLEAEMRPCLLYTCLFDHGMDIGVKELIDYWFGEGFLGRDEGNGVIEKARRNGRQIINKLVSACLLERSSGEEDKVKMHGLIRDMAIKLAACRDEDGKAPVLLVYPDSMTASEQKGENWEQATRISLMGSKVKLPTTGNCPNLKTLLLKNCPGIGEIPPGFFDQMPALRVLDLSNTRIKAFPAGIILKHLHNLNLSHTNVTSLPENTGEMENLRQLNLSFTSQLEKIPHKAITRLANLRTLNLFRSNYRKWAGDASEANRDVILSDLQGLSNLEELALNVKDNDALDDLLDSNLSERTVCLFLEGFQGVTPQTKFHALEKLRELYVANFLKLEKLAFKHQWLLNLEVLELSSLSIKDVVICEEEQNALYIRRLRRLEISHCNDLNNLNWVRHLGCISSLSVSRCTSLKAIIAGDGGQVSFKSLKVITLKGLPELETFCSCKMEMPSAPSLTVDDCPGLKGGSFIYYDAQGQQHQNPY